MIGNVVFGSLAGYGLAKFRFSGDPTVCCSFSSTLMLPLEVTLVPIFLVIKVRLNQQLSGPGRAVFVEASACS